MAGVQISITTEGLKELNEKLSGIQGYINNNVVPFKQASAIITSSVQRNFTDAGSRPQPWPDLSPFTIFVRMHRRSRKNVNPQPLLDSGHLRNSMVPFFKSDEKEGEAGTSTALRYAKTLNDGGTSSPSTVEIAPFRRRAPKSGRSVRVSGYTMHIKGGHRIPARPFMVLREDTKNTLYSLFSDWLRGASNA